MEVVGKALPEGDTEELTEVVHAAVHRAAGDGEEDQGHDAAKELLEVLAHNGLDDLPIHIGQPDRQVGTDYKQA